MEKTESDDKDYFTKTVQFRGYVLEYISAMEYALNSYLAEYFCGSNANKSQDMQILILGDDRMSLSAKAQVFYYIAKNYDEKWYNSYDAIGTSLNKDLIKVIEERNIFAHRLADIDFFVKEDLQKGTIRFIRFKNSIEAVEYNNDKFQGLIDRIMRIIQHFNNREKILHALNFKPFPPYDPNYNFKNDI